MSACRRTTFAKGLVLLFVPLSASLNPAQINGQPGTASALPKLNSTLEAERAKFGIQMIRSAVSGLQLKRANQVTDDVADWVLKNGRAAKNGPPAVAAQFAFVNKNYNQLGEMLNTFRFVGAQKSTGEFLYDPGTLPFSLVDRNGKSTLLVSGLVSENVYNTLKLSANQRAAEVVKGIVIPSLKNFAPFEKSGIDCYGLSVLYASRDFSNSGSSVSEYLAFIVPAKTCHAFVNLEITDQDLLKSADIFVSDRDMGATLRKAAIQIQ